MNAPAKKPAYLSIEELLSVRYESDRILALSVGHPTRWMRRTNMSEQRNKLSTEPEETGEENPEKKIELARIRLLVIAVA